MTEMAAVEDETPLQSELLLEQETGTLDAIQGSCRANYVEALGHLVPEPGSLAQLALACLISPNGPPLPPQANVVVA